MSFLRETRKGCLIDVWLVPRAGKRAVLGEHDGRLRVSVLAPPVESKANKEASRLLADLFSIPPSDVEIVEGHRGRRKTFLLKSVSLNDAARKLEARSSGPQD